jgi:hypothetical protein
LFEGIQKREQDTVCFVEASSFQLSPDSQPRQSAYPIVSSGYREARNNLKSYDRQANINTTKQRRVPAVRVSKSSSICFYGLQVPQLSAPPFLPNLNNFLSSTPTSQYMQKLFWMPFSILKCGRTLFQALQSMGSSRRRTWES